MLLRTCFAWISNIAIGSASPSAASAFAAVTMSTLHDASCGVLCHRLLFSREPMTCTARHRMKCTCIHWLGCVILPWGPLQSILPRVPQPAGQVERPAVRWVQPCTATQYAARTVLHASSSCNFDHRSYAASARNRKTSGWSPVSRAVSTTESEQQ